MGALQEEFPRLVIRLENALEAQTAAAQADAGLQVPQVPLSMGRSQALDVPWESLEINVDGVKVPICFQQPTPPQMLLDPHGVR